MTKYIIVCELAMNKLTFEMKRRFNSEEDARKMIEAHIELGLFPSISSYEINPIEE